MSRLDGTIAQRLAVLLCCSLIGCSRPVDEVTPVDISVSTSLATPNVQKGDWPWWRGVDRNNIATGPEPPLTWSVSENVVWKAEIPGAGHASPIVVDDNVFVFSTIEKDERFVLHCFDRESGEPRWTTDVYQGGLMRSHARNSHASPTPACDGERVFVTLAADGAVRTIAVDLEGEIVWEEESGAFRSQHGYGSSPVIWESLVIVLGDNGAGGFLTAHHRENGKVVWRTRRLNEPSYATPIVCNIEGVDRLVVSGQGDVASYDPATGERQWVAPGPADTTANTLAFDQDLLFAGGGYPQHGLWALEAATGKRRWKLNFKQYVPSPLVSDGRVYVVQDGGAMRCIEAERGKEVWKKRLGGSFSASPVKWEDRIYVPDESGTMFIVRASDTFEKLGECRLDSGGMASPVICDGHIYIRTEASLWKIGHSR